VLDNITHYWLTNSGVSSARIYWDDRANFFDPKGWPTAPTSASAIVEIPAAVSVFPDEIYTPPRSWAEEAYPKPSITTSSTRAGTLPLGSSRSFSQKRSARGSGSSAR
jgi:hypothetical protein